MGFLVDDRRRSRNKSINSWSRGRHAVLQKARLWADPTTFSTSLNNPNSPSSSSRSCGVTPIIVVFLARPLLAFAACAPPWRALRWVAAWMQQQIRQVRWMDSRMWELIVCQRHSPPPRIWRLPSIVMGFELGVNTDTCDVTPCDGVSEVWCVRKRDTVAAAEGYRQFDWLPRATTPRQFNGAGCLEFFYFSKIFQV